MSYITATITGIDARLTVRVVLLSEKKQTNESAGLKLLVSSQGREEDSLRYTKTCSRNVKMTVQVLR